VTLDGTVDASAIYLNGVLFVTTTYGKTEAINASTGAVKWRFTPPGYSSWAGSAQITTATPVADPTEKWIYASSPGGRIYKLATSNGHAVWSVSITKLPAREKIASALNYANGHVIATTGGYIGDQPPYQGHVAVIDAASGRLLHVWNSLCSDVRRERLRHLGPLRRRRRSLDGRSPRRHRKRSVERDDELGRRGAAPRSRREPAAR
jgi:outer membrane protein assembly factor BamB